MRKLFKDVLGADAARAVPAHDVRRGDAPLRLGQAGPAHPARTRRRRRPGARTASSRCSRARRRIRTAASPRCACRRAASKLSRKQIDDYTAFVARYGAKGLAYVKVNDAAKGREGLQSPILKFLSDAAVAGLIAAHAARRRATWSSSAPTRPGSSTTRSARCASSSARTSASWPQAGRRSGSSTSRCSSGTPTRSAGRRCTIRSPRRSTTTRRRSRPSPGQALARAYDMVLNGSEIGGGSVRIHRNEMQSTVFELLGIGAEEAETQVRLPARRAQVRRAAARRHRVRPRPARRC